MRSFSSLWVSEITILEVFVIRMQPDSLLFALCRRNARVNVDDEN
jgi:hypothetical protein